MVTHTSSKRARRKRDRRNEREVREYMHTLRECFPEDFCGEKQRMKHDHCKQPDREARIRYYSERAALGLPLFDSLYRRLKARLAAPCNLP